VHNFEQFPQLEIVQLKLLIDKGYSASQYKKS